MSEREIILQWFENWWRDLPKHHFTSMNKGSKRQCSDEVLKLKPNEELRQHIDWYTRELTLRTARMKSAGIRVAGWKHACRLIKNAFWEDDLPNPLAEKTAANAKEACCVSGCEEAVKYGSVPDHLRGVYKSDLRLCEEHYEAQIGKQNTELNRQALKNKGLWHDKFDTREAWYAACRADSVPRLKKALLGSR